MVVVAIADGLTPVYVLVVVVIGAGVTLEVVVVVPRWFYI